MPCLDQPAWRHNPSENRPNMAPQAAGIGCWLPCPEAAWQPLDIQMEMLLP
jgi:hypothetical protein